MKLALVFLAVLPLVLSRPAEEKRFLEFLHLDHLVELLKTIVHCGMGYDACVIACKGIAGPLVPFCGSACTAVFQDCGR